MQSLTRKLSLPILFILGAMAMSASTQTIAQTASAPGLAGLPAVVIGPPGEDPKPGPGKPTHTLAEFNDMLVNAGAWPTLASYKPAIIKSDLFLNELATDEQLHTWAGIMNGLGLSLELETGVIKNWSQNGAQSFKIDSQIWTRLIKAGFTIDGIAMDDPLGAARKLGMDKGAAIQQVANFVQLVQQNYPTFKIGLINPYPTFQPSDVSSQLSILQADLTTLRARNIDFYRMDVDWHAFDGTAENGSWAGVAQIQAIIHSNQLPFSLIYWAAPYQSQVKQNGYTVNNALWLSDILEEAQNYAATGSTPDQLCIESWIGVPTVAVPETNSITFTGSALSLLQQMNIQP